MTVAAPAAVLRERVKPFELVKASLDTVTEVAASETVQLLFVTYGTEAVMMLLTPRPKLTLFELLKTTEARLLLVVPAEKFMLPLGAETLAVMLLALSSPNVTPFELAKVTLVSVATFVPAEICIPGLDTVSQTFLTIAPPGISLSCPILASQRHLPSFGQRFYDAQILA